MLVSENFILKAQVDSTSIVSSRLADFRGSQPEINNE